MTTKSLKEFYNQSDHIYIDANIFHLAVRDNSKVGKVCINFLKEIENGTIKGVTSLLVLDELMYKLLLKLIETEYKANPLKVLREKRISDNMFNTIATLIEDITSIKNLEIIDIPKTIAFMLPYNFSKYHLMPRDTIHISLMELYGIKHIASADRDFDSVQWITRWTPL